MIVFSILNDCFPNSGCILHPELDPNLLHVSVLVSVQETFKILQSHHISNPLFVVVCRFFSREKPFGLFTDSEPAAGSCCGTWTSMLLLNVWEKLGKPGTGPLGITLKITNYTLNMALQKSPAEMDKKAETTWIRRHWRESGNHTRGIRTD